VIQLISDWTRLGISTENISLQSDKESSAQYGVSEKKKAEYFSTLFLTTDTHTFTFVVGYSKGVFILGLWEIKRHNDADELSTQSLNLTFTPKNSTTYVIKALRQQNTQSLRSLDTTFKIKPESTSKLYLDFEGDMTLQPLQLINQPSLSLHFKWWERIQPPIETDFSLSGTVLLLSTLLE
jgi:hypothetical protein